MFFINFSQQKDVLITVENPISIARIDETISLQNQFLKKLFPNQDIQSFRIKDAKTGQVLITQSVDLNSDSVFEEILFQTSLEPNEKKAFSILPEKISQALDQSKVHAAFVPTGMDDFNWENNQIGYRFYGPTRAKEQATSTGIDVWSKRVPYRMIEKWYHPDTRYHIDTGEGADHYKVGKKRGCGGTGILFNNKIHFSKSFSNWKIIEEGPIRVLFELEFSGWHLNNKQIKEIKRVSLDAGHYLNKFETIYQTEEKTFSFLHAVGITQRPDSETKVDRENGWFGTWESLGKEKGYLGCGIIASTDQIHDIHTQDEHLYMFLKVEISKPIQYYSGAAWSEFGPIKSLDDWKAYIAQQVKCINHPCIVRLKKEGNNE